MRRAVQGLLAGALFLATGEAAVRLARPSPRAQVVREDGGVHLRVEDNVVLWTSAEPVVQTDACSRAPASALHAVFVGSSILRGAGVPGSDVFTERLRARLPPDAVCVDNLAEPGFTGEQKRVTALGALARPRPPDVLYWEVWENDYGNYGLFPDGTAINLFGFVRDPQGYPSVAAVPQALHHALFDHLELWRYAVLALAPQQATRASAVDLRVAEIARDVEPVLRRAAEVGTQVVLVVCPSLDRPFGESAREPALGYGPVATLARERGVRAVWLADALAEEDVEALRLDPCCHYAVAGHRRLAELFEADLLTIRALRGG
ncbi:MAG TPA: hypothetical protein PKA64_20065 [Myxococcota bacterium]|nr:hypothetical protein [Myxococcota bacterium]